jgi:hypothetical protein
METRTLGLLVMSSALNATLCFFVLVFALFATSPDMDDVTMRIGFYVLNTAAAVFLPWIYARKQNNRRALFLALLPLLILCLAMIAFLTLDSWLNRTFS